MSVKWKQHRHEKGYVYHEMTNEFYQVVGFIKPDGKGVTVVANVAVIVSFNMERANDQ